MPVSGLVVTLASSAPAAAKAFEWLQSDDRFQLGEASNESDRRFPLTLDTRDETANRACWDEMQAHDGIDFVDVVCVYFA